MGSWWLELWRKGAGGEWFLTFRMKFRMSTMNSDHYLKQWAIWFFINPLGQGSTKLHFLVPKSNQTIVKDLHFEQNKPNSLCRDKIHLRQYQTITKNSRCTKIQKQYQTKVGLFVTKIHQKQYKTFGITIPNKYYTEISCKMSSKVKLIEHFSSIFIDFKVM